MILCHQCKCRTDRVKCAIEFIESGYTAKLACEDDIEIDPDAIRGRHSTDLLKKDIRPVCTFPSGSTRFLKTRYNLGVW